MKCVPFDKRGECRIAERSDRLIRERRSTVGSRSPWPLCRSRHCVRPTASSCKQRRPPPPAPATVVTDRRRRVPRAGTRANLNRAVIYAGMCVRATIDNLYPCKYGITVNPLNRGGWNDKTRGRITEAMRAVEKSPRECARARMRASGRASLGRGGGEVRRIGRNFSIEEQQTSHTVGRKELHDYLPRPQLDDTRYFKAFKAPHTRGVEEKLYFFFFLWKCLSTRNCFGLHCFRLYVTSWR